MSTPNELADLQAVIDHLHTALTSQPVIEQAAQRAHPQCPEWTVTG